MRSADGNMKLRNGVWFWRQKGPRGTEGRDRAMVSQKKIGQGGGSIEVQKKTLTSEKKRWAARQEKKSLKAKKRKV